MGLGDFIGIDTEMIEGSDKMGDKTRGMGDMEMMMLGLWWEFTAFTTFLFKSVYGRKSLSIIVKYQF